MRKDVVIKRALRKAGYNVDSSNFKYETIYKTAQEMLNEVYLDMQRDIGLKSNVKIATLTQIKDTHSFEYGDFLKNNPGATIYALPSDFIEYVGSTRNNVNSTIVGNYVIVFPKVINSVFLENEDGFTFRYKGKLSIEQMPELMETYCVNYLALELIQTLRPDDGNRIKIINDKLESEKQSFAIAHNMNIALTNKSFKKGWF